jgi:outer membrane protein
MNYWDFSVDIELGDLFNSKSLHNWWAGYSLHHRSAIFEKSSAFGRIKGGSNYNTLYVQYHF